MPLYRAIYYRADKIRGLTFWSVDAEAATSYAHEVIEKCTGVPVLTVIPVRSKLPERSDGRARVHNFNYIGPRDKYEKYWANVYQQQLQLLQQGDRK